MTETPCVKGMLVFQPLPREGLGKVIADATHSPIAHVGILTDEDSKCEVIEAIGSFVHKTPLKEFIARSHGIVWWKKIRNLSPEQINRFVESAKHYLGYPYDFAYLENNVTLLGEKVYCSELVVDAASRAGIDLSSSFLPASWLDRQPSSVAEYLSQVHRIGIQTPLRPDWWIITPRDLFYSDDLVEPAFVNPSTNKPLLSSAPQHAVYDTLPGITYDEKYRYLDRMWGPHLEKVRREAVQKNSHQVWRFSLEINGTSYSLVLFDKFGEEKKLAEAILQRLKS